MEVDLLKRESRQLFSTFLKLSMYHLCLDQVLVLIIACLFSLKCVKSAVAAEADVVAVVPAHVAAVANGEDAHEGGDAEEEKDDDENSRLVKEIQRNVRESLSFTRLAGKSGALAQCLGLLLVYLFLPLYIYYLCRYARTENYLNILASCLLCCFMLDMVTTILSIPSSANKFLEKTDLSKALGLQQSVVRGEDGEVVIERVSKSKRAKAWYQRYFSWKHHGSLATLVLIALEGSEVYFQVKDTRNLFLHFLMILHYNSI